MTVESHGVGVRVEGGVVGRVRQFLADFAAARDSAAPRGADPFRATRLARARREGRVLRDLDELERRLTRLRRAYPELGDVELGPLVGPARGFLESLGDEGASSVGGRPPGVGGLDVGGSGRGSSARAWIQGVDEGR